MFDVEPEDDAQPTPPSGTTDPDLDKAMEELDGADTKKMLDDLSIKSGEESDS